MSIAAHAFSRACGINCILASSFLTLVPFSFSSGSDASDARKDHLRITGTKKEEKSKGKRKISEKEKERRREDRRFVQGHANHQNTVLFRIEL